MQYPFAYGLSYTSWKYSALDAPASITVCGTAQVSVAVSNTGNVNGSEVAMLFVTNEHPLYPGQLRWALAGFERVGAAPGQSAPVVFTLPPLARAEVREEDYERWVMPTTVLLSVGGGKPKQLAVHTTANSLTARVQVTGAAAALDGVTSECVQ